jgi:hypothetical protein
MRDDVTDTSRFIAVRVRSEQGLEVLPGRHGNESKIAHTNSVGSIWVKPMVWRSRADYWVNQHFFQQPDPLQEEPMGYSRSASPERAMRRMVVFLGVLVGAMTVAVGVVGLLAPVSAPSQQNAVQCGSALAPDLSAARSKDERIGTGEPVIDEAAPDKSYTRLCVTNLDDRRIWMLTAAVVGMLALVGTLVFNGATRRPPRHDTASRSGL